MKKTFKNYLKTKVPKWFRENTEFIDTMFKWSLFVWLSIIVFSFTNNFYTLIFIMFGGLVFVLAYRDYKEWRSNKNGN